MTYDSTRGTITRQYLPTQYWGAVEAKILRQNPALAAPIIPADELMDATIASGLLAISAAAGNLTHQLELDRPVYWVVTRARVVNAMIASYRAPDMYCVVIAEGMLETLFYFSVAIMQSDGLAAFLSDGVDPVDAMTPAERSRREAWWKILNDVDEARMKLSAERAFAINFIAMHFLMAHEIGHLAGGHLPLFAGAFTAEAQGSGRPDKAENRVLERDADALAAGATVYLLGNPGFMAGWSDILKDKESGLRHMMAALYIFYSVMDLFGPEDPFAEERTHPPALVRVNVTATMLSLLLDNFGAFDKDEVWELTRRAVRAVEIAVMDLGGGMMTAEEVALLDADVEENLRQHHDLWPGLRARMDRRHLDTYWWSEGLR